MEKNKTGKYLKYAIGEIVLVVIGILIALQINNWNNHQKDLAKEQKVLIQLKGEYEKNLIQLEQKVTMRNDIIMSSTNLLRYIDNPQEATIDSIITQMASIVRDPTFDPIKNDLIESGNLYLIQNESLKLRLSNWSSDVYQVQENELQWQKLRTEFVTPFFIKNGLARDLADIVWKDGYTPIHALDQTIKITTKVGKSSKIPSVESILKNIELEGIASMAITWNNIANIQSLALKKHIIEMLDLIVGEIKH
jgi:hypothetical protein